MGGSPWNNVLVSDVCSLIVDCVNKTAPTVEYKTPFKMIRTTNVRNGKVDLSAVRYVEEDTFSKWTRRAPVLSGDVLLTREAPIGEVGYITEDDTVFLGQRLMQYRADPKILDSRFLLYAFLSPGLKHQFGVHEGTGSVVSHIRVGDCSNFRIPLPPLPEQQAIAHILGALDDKIDLNRRMNETLEAMARALFKSWFIDFDGVTEFQESELGPIPKGWRVGSLGDLIELAYGKALPQKKRVEGPYPVYGSGGITGCHVESLVNGPGIIVGRKGTVGSIYWEENNFFPIDTTFFVRLCANAITLRWIYFWLERLDITRLGTDSAVPGVNRNAVYAQPVIIPSSQSIQKFEKATILLMDKIYFNTRESRSLSSIRDTLLPKLISGEIRVPEVEKIVEEAV